MTRMLFCNTGWMQKYQGLVKDPIIGGGSYVQEHEYGHEIFNFKPYRGFLYGFVQTKSGIDIERLGAPKNAEVIDDVLIVWVARDPKWEPSLWDCTSMRLCIGNCNCHLQARTAFITGNK